MRSYIFLLVFLVLVHRPGVACAQTPMQEVIRASILKWFACVREQRDGDMVDMMDPKVVEQAGGHDKMVGIIKQNAKGIAEAGFKIDSADIGQPSEPVLAGDKLFSIVPAITHCSSSKMKIDVPSYALAISSDQGKTWKFIGGKGLTLEGVQKLFPEFPTTLKFPGEQEITVTPIQ